MNVRIRTPIFGCLRLFPEKTRVSPLSPLSDECRNQVGSSTENDGVCTFKKYSQS